MDYTMISYNPNNLKLLYNKIIGVDYGYRYIALYNPLVGIAGILYKTNLYIPLMVLLLVLTMVPINSIHHG